MLTVLPWLESSGTILRSNDKQFVGSQLNVDVRVVSGVDDIFYSARQVRIAWFS